MGTRKKPIIVGLVIAMMVIVVSVIFLPLSRTNAASLEGYPETWRCVTFYEHAHFKGQTYTTCQFDIRASLGNWSDRISSLKTTGGTNVVVYEHSNFKGKRWFIGGGRSEANLGQIGWGDKISSICMAMDDKNPCP